MTLTSCLSRLYLISEKCVYPFSQYYVYAVCCMLYAILYYVQCAGNIEFIVVSKSHLKWASKVTYHLSIQFVSIQCSISLKCDERLLFEMNSTNDNNRIQNEKNLKEPKHTRTARALVALQEKKKKNPNIQFITHNNRTIEFASWIWLLLF